MLYLFQSKLETLDIQNSIAADKMQRKIDDLENQLIRLQLQSQQQQKANSGGQSLEFKREAAEGSEAVDDDLASSARPPSAALHSGSHLNLALLFVSNLF